MLDTKLLSLSRYRFQLSFVLMAVAGVALLSFVRYLYEQRSPIALAGWEISNEDQVATIDHSAWATVLTHYVVSTNDARLFDYENVSDEHQQLLTDYLASMQAINPNNYPRDEQFAYWVNLYNALTIHLVLENYPVDSIKDIGDGASGIFGPWDNPIASVNGESLTLNNIEHAILRAIWKDNRVHYVLNCASISCPDLLPEPVFANTLDEQLNDAAKDYINHPKSIRFERKKVVVSSIYDWFKSDFGGSEDSIREHLAHYADASLLKRLERNNKPWVYDYDWRLNDPLVLEE